MDNAKGNYCWLYSRSSSWQEFLGSFLAYMSEKSLAKEKDFWNRRYQGVAAAYGNNAAAGGALVPMLTLGVPGSGTTAVLLALLMTLNITPGPLFNERPEVVWGLTTLLIANFVLLILNVPLVKYLQKFFKYQHHFYYLE